MSSSKRRAYEVPLRVNAASPAVAITVVDGNFAKVAEGGGSLEVKLPAGIYSVRFQAGESVSQQSILLRPDAIEVELEQEDTNFATSVPLQNASSRKGNHERAASKLSQGSRRMIGKGGELLVFVRDVDRRTRSIATRGLTLHSADGEKIADLEREAKQSRSVGPPWAGCLLQLEPGPYRLRLRGGDTGTVEQMLYIAGEWQTQLFLERQPEPLGGRGRRANLAEGSVLMTRSSFDSEQVDTEMTELARQALRDRTLSVPESMLRAMLESKREDPMLGIYAGHLLLMREEPNTQMLAEVVENLRRLVDGHPDVDALALALDGGATLTSNFALPPMLQSSWSIIISASASREGLVPPGSLSDAIAGKIIPGGAWLLWQAPGQKGEERGTQRGSQQELAVAIAEMAEASGFPKMQELAASLHSSGELGRIAEDVVSYAALLAAYSQERDVPVSDLVNDDATVVEALAVPRSVAELAIDSVLDRLDL
jgi:hypothetical protein